jgi:hypothetical protein
MNYTEKLIKLWKDLNISFPEVTALAVAVILLGLILLSFTFILPILVFFAALIIIFGAIYLIYRLLGGS